MAKEIKITENHAYLFVGEQNTIRSHATTYIQQKICLNNNGCRVCVYCLGIEQKTYYNMRWLTTEKIYTKDDIATVFKALSFVLNKNETFFIVIEKADYLSHVCANSLLKSIEEPPQGYHFIFLTDRLDQILPTIKSRCAVQNIASLPSLATYDPLEQIFMSNTKTDPVSFLKLLDKSDSKESHTYQLLNKLLSYWITLYKTALSSGSRETQQKASAIIEILKNSIKHPPMPGSSKIAWKNLFLQIQPILKAER